MDRETAETILHATMSEFRRRSYRELVSMLGRGQRREILAPDGTRFQVEVQVVWDGPRDGPVRVIGAIDDGRARALKPLTTDFLLGPDGRFLDER